MKQARINDMWEYSPELAMKFVTEANAWITDAQYLTAGVVGTFVSATYRDGTFKLELMYANSIAKQIQVRQDEFDARWAEWMEDVNA